MTYRNSIKYSFTVDNGIIDPNMWSYFTNYFHGKHRQEAPAGVVITGQAHVNQHPAKIILLLHPLNSDAQINYLLPENAKVLAHQLQIKL